MATETLSPDSLLLQVNLSGTVSDIQDDPDSPDANWLTAGSNTVSTICHVTFPTPSGDLTTGADVQEFRVLWRTSSTGDTPDQIQIHLFENGSSVTLNLVNVLNPAGQSVYSATWNAADLANIDGSLVECYVLTTADTSPPPQTATGEIGAIEWNVVYDVSSQTITDVPFISSGNTVFAASVLASDYTVSDLDYISPSNTLHEPDVLPQEYTITDVDYISPSSQLFDPSVNLVTRIDDLDYISPSNILYDPTTQLSYTVSDLDYISPSNTIHDPSIQLSYTITDLDYIPSGNSLHEPVIGIKPVVNSKDITTPWVEGEEALANDIFYNWYGADSLNNVGDIPDGLVFGTLINLVSHLSGTFSDVSAGTYNIQHSATNQFGTTLSSIDELVVKERIVCDYIPSSSQLFEPDVSLDTLQIISDLDYISPSNVLYDPSTQLSYTITDVDYIAPTNLLYQTALFLETWWVSGHYRFENDDGTTLDDSTFIDAEDTQINLDVDTNFRLRINWGTYTQNGQGKEFKCEVQFDINDAEVWNQVSGTTECKSALSSILDDNDTSTTERLATAPTGTNNFEFVYFDENAISTAFNPTNFKYYEFVFNMLLDSAQLNHGDKVEFRLFDRNSLEVFTVVDTIPTLIVVKTKTIDDLDFIDNVKTLYDPTVSSGAGPQTISDLDFITSASLLYDPELLPQEVTITDLDYISTSSQLFDPSVSIEGAPQTITDLGFITSSSLLHEPDLLPQEVTITDVDFITSTKALYDPSTALTYSITDVDFISSSSVLYDPNVFVLVANQINSDFIPSSSNLFEPLLVPGEVSRSIDFISSTRIVHNVASVISSYNIPVGYINPTNILYDPSVVSPSVNVEIDFIAKSSQAFTPNVTGITTRLIDFISSAKVLFDPTVTVGAATIQVDFIPSSHLLHEPVFGGATLIGVDYIAPSSSVFVPYASYEAYHIDIIVFDLNINLVVDKTLYFDTMINRSLYIDQVLDNTLDLTVNNKTESEL